MTAIQRPITKRDVHKRFGKLRRRNGIDANLHIYYDRGWWGRGKWTAWASSTSYTPTIGVNLYRVNKAGLTPDEVEGVLAHEQKHIKDADPGTTYFGIAPILCGLAAAWVGKIEILPHSAPSLEQWAAFGAFNLAVIAGTWAVREAVGVLTHGQRSHPQERAADDFALKTCGHDGIITALPKFRRLQWLPTPSHPSIISRVARLKRQWAEMQKG